MASLNTGDHPETITIASSTFYDEEVSYAKEIRVYIPQPVDDSKEYPQAFFGGDIPDDEPSVIIPHPLYVEHAHRGHGIGEALVRRLVEEARKEKVTTIRGHIESQYALDIRARIFGKESMKFFLDDDDEFDGDHYRYELPMTFEQARASLVRAETYEELPDAREFGFIVEQDITDIPQTPGEK